METLLSIVIKVMLEPSSATGISEYVVQFRKVVPSSAK